MANALPGDLIPVHGVFVGTWICPTLSKNFNVFAAPEDLVDEKRTRLLLSFNDAITRVAALQNWHGHNGSLYERENDFYRALAAGSYKGEWFIPTYEFLAGRNNYNTATNSANILAQYKIGSFKHDLAVVEQVSGSDFTGWYWSSSVPHRKDNGRSYPDFRWGVCFEDGKGDTCVSKFDNPRLNCRVIRLVPAPN